MMAATLCQDKIAKLLVERNASLNLMDTDGVSVLWAKCDGKNEAVFFLQIQRGNFFNLSISFLEVWAVGLRRFHLPSHFCLFHSKLPCIWLQNLVICRLWNTW